MLVNNNLCNGCDSGDYFGTMAGAACCLSCSCCSNDPPTPPGAPPAQPSLPPLPAMPPPSIPALADYFEAVPNENYYLPSSSDSDNPNGAATRVCWDATSSSSVANQLCVDMLPTGLGYSELNLAYVQHWCLTYAIDPATRNHADVTDTYAVVYYGTDAPTRASPDSVGGDDWFCMHKGPVGPGTCEGYQDCMQLPGGIDMSADGTPCLFCGWANSATWVRKSGTIGAAPIAIEPAALTRAAADLVVPPSPPSIPPQPQAPDRMDQANHCYVPIDGKFAVGWDPSCLVDTGTDDDYTARVNCVDDWACHGVARENVGISGYNWQKLMCGPLGNPGYTITALANAHTYYRIRSEFHGCGWQTPPNSPPDPPAPPPPAPCLDAVAFSVCRSVYIDTGTCGTADAQRDCEMSCGWCNECADRQDTCIGAGKCPTEALAGAYFGCTTAAIQCAGNSAGGGLGTPSTCTNLDVARYCPVSCGCCDVPGFWHALPPPSPPPPSPGSQANPYTCPPLERSWADARDYCANIGQTLAVPHSEEEMNAIWAARASYNSQWIGIHDLDGDGVFEGLDGAWSADIYTRWYAGNNQPALGGARCVVFRYQDLDWVSNTCGTARRFCCQTDIDRNPLPSLPPPPPPPSPPPQVIVALDPNNPQVEHTIELDGVYTMYFLGEVGAHGDKVCWERSDRFEVPGNAVPDYARMMDAAECEFYAGQQQPAWPYELIAASEIEPRGCFQSLGFTSYGAKYLFNPSTTSTVECDDGSSANCKVRMAPCADRVSCYIVGATASDGPFPGLHEADVQIVASEDDGTPASEFKMCHAPASDTAAFAKYDGVVLSVVHAPPSTPPPPSLPPPPPPEGTCRDNWVGWKTEHCVAVEGGAAGGFDCAGALNGFDLNAGGGHLKCKDLAPQTCLDHTSEHYGTNGCDGTIGQSCQRSCKCASMHSNLTHRPSP